MSRRRRPHPARRARRVAGATAIGAYAGLVVTVGWSQRAAEADAATAPEPLPETTDALAGIERLDLGAAATFRDPEAGDGTPSVSTTTSPSVAPTPPPPPSLAATTTTVPRVTAPPPTAPPTTAAASPTTTAPAPTTTAAPTTTTTTIAPTTTPPPTSIPTGGS